MGICLVIIVKILPVLYYWRYPDLCIILFKLSIYYKLLMASITQWMLRAGNLFPC